jgi:DNA-binding transcriptional LysR family regulator
VLALARSGSLSAAARSLRVTHTTVLRRLDVIEERLQVRLFERLRSGYQATAAGETLRLSAEQCEPLVAQAERHIMGGDTRLTGNLRVSTAHVLALHLLPSALALFHAEHTKIVVEVRASRERVDLARREADIALRMTREVPDTLVGRQLGQIRVRVYGWHQDPRILALSGHGLPDMAGLLRDFPWIGFDGQDRIYDRWVDAHVPLSAIVARADHFPSALALLRAGLGLTILPEFVALDTPGLVALSEPIEALQTPLWILTHADLRHTARVRAFMQTVGNDLEKTLAAIL